jgi:hypothetical protein
MAKDMIKDSKQINKLLTYLGENSEYLENQGRQVRKLVKKKRVISFYETHTTRAVKKVCIPLE